MKNKRFLFSWFFFFFYNLRLFFAKFVCQNPAYIQMSSEQNITVSSEYILYISYCILYDILSIIGSKLLCMIQYNSDY